MNEVNRIINECGLSKVRIAKYLGVSRQMLYNYLGYEEISELPTDKKNKIFNLLNITNEDDVKKIKVTPSFVEELNSRLNDGIIESYNRDTFNDLKGLNKKEQELLSDIFSLLKDKLVENNKNLEAYDTLKYLYYYIQTMENVDELKYILAYMAKYNGIIPAMEFIYNEDKQYTFEGILYTAMALYNNGTASRSKVAESHKRFETEIENKKEEKLSRTQELNTLKVLALQELGYTTINENNAKEVFEKIAEIMSRKF